MNNNGLYEITIQATVFSQTEDRPVYLAAPWAYDNYQDPKVHRLPNDTPLYIGNIGYCPLTSQLGEIILFFADETGRLMRTAEFRTDKLKADLEQVFCLQASSPNIKYNASQNNHRDLIYLQENIQFFKEWNTQLIHEIRSESHCLIDFGNGLKLTESALRHATQQLEATVPYFIDKLFPDQGALIPSEAVKQNLSHFLSRHSIKLIDNKSSGWTFSEVIKNNNKEFHASLSYKIRSRTSDSALSDALSLIREHHQRIDPYFVGGGQQYSPIEYAYDQCEREPLPEKKQVYLKIIQALESIVVIKKLSGLIVDEDNNHKKNSHDMLLNDIQHGRIDELVAKLTQTQQAGLTDDEMSSFLNPLLYCAHKQFLEQKTEEQQNKQLEMIKLLEDFDLNNKTQRAIKTTDANTDECEPNHEKTLGLMTQGFFKNTDSDDKDPATSLSTILSVKRPSL